jgi:hypothetical protein
VANLKNLYLFICSLPQMSETRSLVLYRNFKSLCILVTKRRDHLAVIFFFRIWEVPNYNFCPDMAILTTIFCGFPSYRQKNSEILSKIRPRPLPSTAFPIHHHHHVAINESLVDPFRSHASRSLFSGLPCFLLPFGCSFLLVQFIIH